MASVFEDLKAHYGECDTLPFTNGSGSQIDGNTIREEQNKVGIVKEDVADGDDTVMVVGVPAPGIDVPKDGNAWSAGDEIVYDTGNTQFSNNTANGPTAGHCYADAASGDSKGRVVLTNEQGVV